MPAANRIAPGRRLRVETPFVAIVPEGDRRPKADVVRRPTTATKGRNPQKTARQVY